MIRVWCFKFSVSGQGFGYGKKKNLTLSQIFFSGYSYSRTVACCGCLTSKQTALIYTTHIKKVTAKLHCFTLRSKITEKQ